MSSTTTTTDSDYEPTNEVYTSTEQVCRKKKRLFWSDGNAAMEKSYELEIPKFNTVEAGYLADDESDTEEEPFAVKVEVKHKKRVNEMSRSSSLFFSDSDGFEERAML